jgi:hypothetical protein
MIKTAKGTCDLKMVSVVPGLYGAITRSELTKDYSGDLEGSSLGVAFSAGDPQAGRAGYVSMETVSARLGQRRGTFALQLFGVMDGGTQALECEVVPGSGTADLVGINGRLSIIADTSSRYRYELIYYFVT